MSSFFLATLSFVCLLVISAGVSYWAWKAKIPATVALVGTGMLIAFAAKHGYVGFLDAFELTPEILFYVFLPILLFESAYNVRYKELLRSIRSVSLLAVVSLVISAFTVAFWLRYGLLAFGIDVPFEVTLLFGALISSTDTAAVLSVFKELGVPRRLNLIFEGESLFNDGTAIALFLIVLGVVESHATGGVPTQSHSSLFETFFDTFGPALGSAGTFVEGLASFGSMIGVGIFLWAAVGVAFSKVIQKIRNEKHLEITLSLALAHATFLLAEAVNHFAVPTSGIVATVAAAMVLGNYGRYKISPKVEEVMEKYWSFFAFVTNCLVFVLVGMMLVNLNADWKPLLLPILLAVPTVVLARAVSVYPAFSLLNFSKTEERVPRSWQHVLSWWALRGGLAVMMALLVPDLTLPWWSVEGVSVRDFIISLTLGCVVFSVFVKTITIAPLIRRFKIDALHEIEEFEYAECRILMASEALEKIRRIRKSGYVDSVEERFLAGKYEKILESARSDARSLMEKKWAGFGDLVRRVAALHALWIEKYWLKRLYKYNEIPERVFKKIMKRVAIQTRRVEKGESQIERARLKKPKTDVFERIAEYFVDRLEPEIDPVKEKYLELRTIHIVTEKALEGLVELGKVDFVGNREEFDEVVKLYEGFHASAERIRKALFREHKDALRKLSAKLTEKSLIEAEESVLEDLAAKEIVSPKLALRFEKELSRRLHGG